MDSEVELEQEILELREEIQRLTLENEQLQKQLESQRQWMDQIQHTIMDTTPSLKRGRKLSKETRAKFIFYQQHKTDTNVIKCLTDKMSQIGFNGIPWLFVKQETDAIFDKLSNEAKEDFYRCNNV